MTSAIFKMLGAVLVAAALAGPQYAKAEPMKCSGEEKTCITACRKVARTPVNVCLTGCGARLSACLKNGCWDTGTQRYCGLSKL